ncbi:hypothetical protein E2C01_076345 [Portunus trituberculatus]|uniref:Uncharacterized protein n=1 Tax=Portunus trituberculatus TaxID=210409 RepID=A0A5B7INB3_PORTR|nr:hypothetical protein [Portunus trituberculatus]
MDECVCQEKKMSSQRHQANLPTFPSFHLPIRLPFHLNSYLPIVPCSLSCSFYHPILFTLLSSLLSFLLLHLLHLLLSSFPSSWSFLPSFLFPSRLEQASNWEASEDQRTSISLPWVWRPR